MRTNSTIDRRNFLKISTAAGGGFLLGFNWFQKATAAPEVAAAVFEPNAYIQISNLGVVTLMAPNPEVGQNIKVALPMIVAEELDVDWKTVKIEQAPLDTVKYSRQVAGGSGSIRHGWDILRKAGATARKMLIQAAADTWKTDPSNCYTDTGKVINRITNKSLNYGDLAEKAVKVPVPEEAPIKEVKDFRIIGTKIPNVDNPLIVTGKLKYGFDTRRDGMLLAMVARPPAFGKKLKSWDDSETRKLPGIVNVVQFDEKVAVLGHHTWQLMKGLKALKLEWEDGETLESTTGHFQEFQKTLEKRPSEPKRSEGDIDQAFSNASKVIETTFEIPFLPHAPMEPMNFFADVREGGVELYGPTQTPARARTEVSKMLNIPEEKITVKMTRIGGGFGRRLMTDFATEAAMVSKLAKAPVNVVWTREDDMQGGFYRPAGLYRYRAAIDGNNRCSAWHLHAVSINTGNGTRPDNFPAGALPNYRVDYHDLKSNITTGPWRAPTHNFIAYTEESFLDEVAHTLGKDPVAYRLELLEEARNKPVGKVAYNVDRYKKVVEMAAEKAGWGKPKTNGIHQGFGAHFSFGSYVAMVADVSVQDGDIKVHKITACIDCGIIINRTGAENQMEGGIIDGLGHAMFSELTFKDGKVEQPNFGAYKLIKMADSPEIALHFVESNERPEGLGEPGLPPTAAAVANAIFAATGVRVKKMPFVMEKLS